MSDRYKGAILSPTAPTVTPQSAGGIYTSSQQLQYQGQGVWPQAVNNPINNSLRFRNSASAYLSRTPTVSGSGTTFTWSGWIKRGVLGGGNLMTLYSAGTGDAALGVLYFDNSTNKLSFLNYNGAYNWNIVATPAYRDPSAWYHFVAVVDTTQATASNRIKLYVNGVQITAFDTASYPTQNYSTPFFNQSGIAQFIGRWGTWNASHIYDGYMAEINFIDGTALTPSSFGTTDAYGIWQPIPYTGSYGTNGFYLPFRLNSTSSFYGSFNGSSQYLSLTANSSLQFGTGDFTVEGWYYQNGTVNFGNIFSTTLLFGTTGGLRLSTGPNNNTFQVATGGSGLFNASVAFSASRWNHFAVVRSSGVTTLYQNGVSVGSASDSNSYTANTFVIGWVDGSGSSAYLLNGLLSNFRVVKGTAVYTANFTPSTSPLTAISGTSLLTLQNATIIDNSTNAFSITNSGSVTTTATTDIFAQPTLTSDYSGNNNSWTQNNISLTSGSTYDSMTDVPTNTNSNTANYCVLNPLDTSVLAMSNGNLQASSSTASWNTTRATVGITSGKFYWEYQTSSNNSAMVGIETQSASLTTYIGNNATGYAYNANDGQKYNNGSGAAYGATYGNGDIIGVAFDADNRTLTFYKNNTSQGTAFSSILAGTYFPSVSINASAGTVTNNINFGQQPFSYTPPTGFLPLNTYNLPTPTILDGDQYFNATLYTGNGTTQTITNAGSMQPDFVWLKSRTDTYWHFLLDSVRGATKTLESNLTNAEATYANNLTSFNSNGFSLGNQNDVNLNASTFVAWQWRASNAAGVSNTQGTITSTVSANTTAGFSIVTYTGNGGTSATVGHGLGVAPSMIIYKVRSNALRNWIVYHVSLGSTRKINLNLTDADEAENGNFGGLSPTSTTFGVGYAATNGSSETFVAYCFSAVAGYSAFGSYAGNASTDGPFIYTGFRPRFVLLKIFSGNTGNWLIIDSARNTYNVVNLGLNPDASDAEFTSTVMDFTSNGFKLRSSAVSFNGSGCNYIYMAFAENPFKIARGR